MSIPKLTCALILFRGQQFGLDVNQNIEDKTNNLGYELEFCKSGIQSNFRSADWQLVVLGVSTRTMFLDIAKSLNLLLIFCETHIPLSFESIFGHEIENMCCETGMKSDLSAIWNHSFRRRMSKTNVFTRISCSKGNFYDFRSMRVCSSHTNPNGKVAEFGMRRLERGTEMNAHRMLDKVFSDVAQYLSLSPSVSLRDSTWQRITE